VLERGRVGRVVVVIWRGAGGRVICMVALVVTLIQLLLLNAGQRHGLHPAGHGRVVCIVGLGHVVPRLRFHAPVSKAAGSEGANQGSGQHRRGPIDRPDGVRRARSSVAATTHACEPSAVQPMVGGGAALAASPAGVSGRELGRVVLHGSRDSTQRA
jgi:hypothetical protein